MKYSYESILYCCKLASMRGDGSWRFKALIFSSTDTTIESNTVKSCSLKIVHNRYVNVDPLLLASLDEDSVIGFCLSESVRNKGSPSKYPNSSISSIQLCWMWRVRRCGWYSMPSRFWIWLCPTHNVSSSTNSSIPLNDWSLLRLYCCINKYRNQMSNKMK